MYILIAIAYMSYHGNSGIALMNQEFRSLSACQNAKKELLALQEHKQVRAVCVEK